MLRYLSADYVYTLTGPPLKGGIIAVEECGGINQILQAPPAGLPDSKVEHFPGALTPGFINAHCHLELSHLGGRVEKKSGLLPFLARVMSRPPGDTDELEAAMRKADASMYRSGIVAVGDISNLPLSKDVKRESSIYYHTFIELAGFEPEQASARMQAGLALKNSFHPLPCSLVPHAPYSVSPELFDALSKQPPSESALYSIHNQESEAEDQWYREKEGAFQEFYKALNKDTGHFQPSGKSALQSILPVLPKNKKILLVHNTYTRMQDLKACERYVLELYWCLCPNANLYIEDRLPDIDALLRHGASIVLGTDSLASNDQLCILAEMKTIQRFFPHISLQQLLLWASLNGARFFGLQERLGSLSPGKRPGINWITELKDQSITEKSAIIKII